MRKNDAGIGEQPAPIAGVVCTFPQIHDQVDQVSTARTEVNRRPPRRYPRAVGGNQHVGLEQTGLVLVAELRKPRGADLLSHFNQKFRVEAELPALGDHRRKRANVDAVLSFIVCGSTAVEAVALDSERPGREPGSPALVHAANGIAMAVDQNGWNIRPLHAIGEKDWGALRIFKNAGFKSQRLERGRDLLIEVTAQFKLAFGLLAGARDRDAALEIGDKFAAVEIGVRASDGGGAAHTDGSWPISKEKSLGVHGARRSATWRVICIKSTQ